jgi:hypothetical protein
VGIFDHIDFGGEGGVVDLCSDQCSASLPPTDAVSNSSNTEAGDILDNPGIHGVT